MSEEPGRYDPRPPDRHGNRDKPEPLGEILHRFVEERDWTHLLPGTPGNGHPGRDSRRRHRHG